MNQLLTLDPTVKVTSVTPTDATAPKVVDYQDASDLQGPFVQSDAPF